MFGDVAHCMMEIMGKAVSAQGIVTVEQLPDAIEQLRSAIASDKAQQAAAEEAARSLHESSEGSVKQERVRLAQRAVPLMELLERSLKSKKPVIWG